MVPKSRASCSSDLQGRVCGQQDGGAGADRLSRSVDSAENELWSEPMRSCGSCPAPRSSPLAQIGDGSSLWPHQSLATVCGGGGEVTSWPRQLPGRDHFSREQDHCEGQAADTSDSPGVLALTYKGHRRGHHQQHPLHRWLASSVVLNFPVGPLST